MKKLSMSDKCTLLGYILRRNVKDVFGNSFAFGTFPAYDAGGHNFFNSAEEVEKWIKQVNEIRLIQLGGEMSLIDYLEQR
jgi:hypothetical protein